MSTRPSHITTGAILVGILSVVLMLAAVWTLVTTLGVARADVGLGRLGLFLGVALLILGLVFSFLAWGLWIEEPWATSRPVGVTLLATCLGLLGVGAVVFGVGVTLIGLPIGYGLFAGIGLALTGVFPLFMARGLWNLKRWAWGAVLACTALWTLGRLLYFSVPDIALGAVTIYYLTRPAVKRTFEGSRVPVTGAQGPETTQEMKQGRDRVWKIYFGFLVVGGVALYVYQGVSRWEMIDLAVTVISLMGLYAFSWRKELFRQAFWKGFLPVFVLWHLAYFYVLPLAPNITEEDLGGPRWVAATLSVAVLAPLAVALYRYGFKGTRAA